MSLLQAPSASHSPSRDQAHHRRCRCGLSPADGYEDILEVPTIRHLLQPRYG